MSAAETQIRLAYLDRDHLFEIGVDEISFEENGVEYRPFPDARFYVIIDSAKGERLTAFWNDKPVATRELIGPGESRISFKNLVGPVGTGLAYFEVLLSTGETVRSKRYGFVPNIVIAYQDHQERMRQGGAEQRRLAAQCPPPAEGATYDSLIAAKLAQICERSIKAELLSDLFAGLACQVQRGTRHVLAEAKDIDWLIDDMNKAMIQMRQHADVLAELLAHVKYYEEEKESSR